MDEHRQGIAVLLEPGSWRRNFSSRRELKKTQSFEATAHQGDSVGVFRSDQRGKQCVVVMRVEIQLKWC